MYIVTFYTHLASATITSYSTKTDGLSGATEIRSPVRVWILTTFTTRLTCINYVCHSYYAKSDGVKLHPIYHIRKCKTHCLETGQHSTSQKTQPGHIEPQIYAKVETCSIEMTYFELLGRVWGVGSPQVASLLHLSELALRADVIVLCHTPCPSPGP